MEPVVADSSIEWEEKGLAETIMLATVDPNIELEELSVETLKSEGVD